MREKINKSPKDPRFAPVSPWPEQSIKIGMVSYNSPSWRFSLLCGDLVKVVVPDLLILPLVVDGLEGLVRLKLVAQLSL